MTGRYLSRTLRLFIVISLGLMIAGIADLVLSGSDFLIKTGIFLLVFTPSAGLLIICVYSKVEGKKWEFLLSLLLLLFLIFNFLSAYFF